MESIQTKYDERIFYFGVFPLSSCKIASDVGEKIYLLRPLAEVKNRHNFSGNHLAMFL